MMEYVIGGMMAVAVIGLGVTRRLGACRNYFPIVLIVSASYYVLFAVMGGSMPALLAEIGFASLVSLVALIGFRKNLWFVAGGMIGHGVYDFFHRSIGANPGVPQWWPGFCMAFDVVAGMWMAARRGLKLAPPSLYPESGHGFDS